MAGWGGWGNNFFHSSIGKLFNILLFKLSFIAQLKTSTKPGDKLQMEFKSISDK